MNAPRINCFFKELERHKLKERNGSQKNTRSFDLSVHA
jgi:hypothetical protein